MKTKSWSGFLLPAHLDYEEAVEHCVKVIERQCALVDATAPARDVCEALIRNWGLPFALEMLMTSLRESGKIKQWMELTKA